MTSVLLPRVKGGDPISSNPMKAIQQRVRGGSEMISARANQNVQRGSKTHLGMVRNTGSKDQ